MSAELTAGRGASKRTLAAVLWAINLSSISASVLVYLFLAHHAYSELQSLRVSEFVLLAPMVMPVLLAFQLNQLATRVPVRQLLLSANLIGVAICAVLFLWAPLNAPAVLVGATLIGAIDAVQRVARIVALKRYFSTTEVRFTVPLTLTAQFIAGALAGAILAFARDSMTVGLAASATVLLFGLGAACTLLLPADGETPGMSAAIPRLSSALRLVRSQPALGESLAAFVLLGTFFQGFYNVSRVALPAHHLHLPQAYVGVLQIVASLAAVAGAVAYFALSSRRVTLRVGPLYIACALAMILSCALPGGAAVSYPLYFVYFFVFELAFFRLQSDIMVATATHQMPLVATVQYACVYIGMMAAIALGTSSLAAWGLTATAVLFVAGFAVAQAALRSIGMRARAMEEGA